MRASTASMILAFCAMVAVQGAPVSGDSAIVARTEPWTYDAEGNEIEKRTEPWTYDAEGNEIEKRVEPFTYDAEGNEIEARQPKKKAAKKAKKAKRDSDFSYDAEGNELIDGEEAEKRDFSYNAEGDEIDAEGNVVDKRDPKKKKAKKAKRDSDFSYDAEGNELIDGEEAEKRDFSYNAEGDEIDAEGNVVDKRDPKKKKAKKAKRDSDFSYDAEGNELIDGEEAEKRDFSYNAEGDEIDAEGNVVEKRSPKKKAKKAKKAKF